MTRCQFRRRSEGARIPLARSRHLGPARAHLRARRRAGAAARLPPHRHRRDVRQRARGGGGAARLRRAARRRVRRHQGVAVAFCAARACCAPPRRAWCKLRLSEVDLLLLHWPNPQIPLSETLGALCKVKEAGLARHIGVSNFTVALIEEATTLVDRAAGLQPDRDASVPRPVEGDRRPAGRMAWRSWPTARSRAATPRTTRVLARIGKAHGKTAAQVCLRFLVQQDDRRDPAHQQDRAADGKFRDLRFRAFGRRDGRDRRARTATAASSIGLRRIAEVVDAGI